MDKNRYKSTEMIELQDASVSIQFVTLLQAFVIFTVKMVQLHRPIPSSILYIVCCKYNAHMDVDGCPFARKSSC